MVLIATGLCRAGSRRSGQVPLPAHPARRGGPARDRTASSGSEPGSGHRLAGQDTRLQWDPASFAALIDGASLLLSSPPTRADSREPSSWKTPTMRPANSSADVVQPLRTPRSGRNLAVDDRIRTSRKSAIWLLSRRRITTRQSQRKRAALVLAMSELAGQCITYAQATRSTSACAVVFAEAADARSASTRPLPLAVRSPS
jgi:hypothetical protein